MKQILFPTTPSINCGVMKKGYWLVISRTEIFRIGFFGPNIHSDLALLNLYTYTLPSRCDSTRKVCKIKKSVNRRTNVFVFTHSSPLIKVVFQRAVKLIITISRFGTSVQYCRGFQAVYWKFSNVRGYGGDMLSTV